MVNVLYMFNWKFDDFNYNDVLATQFGLNILK